MNDKPFGSAVAVTAQIPCGSIDVVDTTDAADLQLRLRRDPGPDGLAIGYYHFRSTGPRGQRRRFRILDVRGDASGRLPGRDDIEDGWTGTGPHASYDLVNWFRIPAHMEGGDFVFEHVPEQDVCYYARWAPYTPDRLQNFLAGIQSRPRVRSDVLGLSVQGRELQRLVIGEPAPGRKVCWVIARQHPSETMASWFVEGLVERLVDEQDPVSKALLDRAVFHIVPDMNPDGSALGHTRANAAGVNLNREWVSPDPELSPEVWWVRREMEATGVDFCMDCHGDEELRCNFLGGPLEIPSRSARLRGLFRGFENAWAAASPDYEMGHPYPGGSPAEADLRMAWNWIAERFHCLSVLLEQPFKDTSWRSDPVAGWSPPRARRFGQSLPTALLNVVETLR
jgi:murein tripeptide amidase MpaA